MTTGSTDNVDATLLRDLARAGGPEGIAPEHTSPAETPEELRARLAELQAWVDTTLDRVPDSYGTEPPATAVIDRWLDDLVNLHDKAGEWRVAREETWDQPALLVAEAALAEAVDRVRTDEEGETDAGRH